MRTVATALIALLLLLAVSARAGAAPVDEEGPTLDASAPVSALMCETQPPPCFGPPGPAGACRTIAHVDCFPPFQLLVFYLWCNTGPVTVLHWNGQRCVTYRYSCVCPS